METYINIAKGLIDHIAATTDKISNRKQGLYILGGLGNGMHPLSLQLLKRRRFHL